MTVSLRHFAINASDVPTAQRFYRAVFDWGFTPWGPPGFFHIDSGDQRLQGALQQRRDLVPGQPVRGLEGTFAVPDVVAVRRAALRTGGRVLMEPTTIAGVGELVWLADPDGNVVGAMRYDPGAE
jgi:predicted enzyme related to lactoylglutathione lyase